MLHEKQLKCIEMLVTGDWTKTEIAREVDISRQAIYDWLDNNAEFKAELDKRLQQIKNQTQRNYVSKLPKAIEEYWKICTSATDVRTKEKALAYWQDRCLGRISNLMTIEDKREDDGNIDVLAAFDAVVSAEDEEKE